MESEAASNQMVEQLLAHLRPPEPIVDREADSRVASFYANRSVFITGATGFIGKALIEKLIRSCPSLARIFILVREKRGKSVQERLAEFVKSQSFDRIRQLHGGSSRLLEEKLVAVQGDITQAKFGISPEDMRLLSDECSIVINSAATIRFVEPIEIAVRNNIYSVGQLVEFCDQLEHLEALVHLSTAYSNCNKSDTIHEIFYEPPMSGDGIMKTIDQLREVQAKIHVCPEVPDAAPEPANSEAARADRSACKWQRFYTDQWRPDPSAPPTLGHKAYPTMTVEGCSSTFDLLEQFTSIALRRANRPNTYTFTKAISENYLLEEVRARPDRYLNNKIPVAIVRPSIVIAAWREPFVGYIDNYNGATGVITSMYTGALQAMPCQGERVADLVPIDMVANMVLCTGWFLVEKSKRDRQARDEHNDNDDPAEESPLLGNGIQSDKGIYLFNFVSGFRNPLCWGQINVWLKEFSYRYPTKCLLRMPRSYIIQAGKFYELFDFAWQKLPALCADFVKSRLLCRPLEGRASSMWGYQRIKQMTDTLTPFTHNQWRFSDANTLALYKSLGRADRRLFPFDVASISWPEYMLAYMTGVRVYMLRDEVKNLPAALTQLQRWRGQNALIMGLLFALVYWFFLRGTLAETHLLGILAGSGGGGNSCEDHTAGQ